jgi:hypothetical protein
MGRQGIAARREWEIWRESIKAARPQLCSRPSTLIRAMCRMRHNGVVLKHMSADESPTRERRRRAASAYLAGNSNGSISERLRRLKRISERLRRLKRVPRDSAHPPQQPLLRTRGGDR